MDPITVDSTEYLDLLGERERQIVYGAQSLIRAALPTGNEVLAYARLNLETQDDLNNLLSNVTMVYNRKYSQMRTLESRLRDSYKEDGIKAREERDVAVHSDSKWVDLHLSASTLQVLMRRLEALSWNLRNALAIVTHSAK